MIEMLHPAHPDDGSTVDLLRWEDLARAIESNELELHYQPIVNLVDGSLTGFEALVRWLHPRFGMLSACHFIGLAESHGLIRAIDEWVLHEGCAQLAQWQEAVLVDETFLLTINVSSSELDGRSLVERMKRVIQTTGVDPAGLVVELTETCGVTSLPLALESAAGLQEMGVRLAIDDFGSQYSWFSRLGALPFDILKIDRELIDASDTAVGASIVRAIVELGTSMGTMMVAEGIENEEQLRRLRSLGCHEGQGFYWSRALDPAAAHGLLSGGVWPIGLAAVPVLATV